jgi:hypothetical protein
MALDSVSVYSSDFLGSNIASSTAKPLVNRMFVLSFRGSIVSDVSMAHSEKLHRLYVIKHKQIVCLLFQSSYFIRNYQDRTDGGKKLSLKDVITRHRKNRCPNPLATMQ